MFGKRKKLLIGTCYEIGGRVDIINDFSVKVYDIYQTKDGLSFSLVEKIACATQGAVERAEQWLRSQGNISKNEWLEKKRQYLTSNFLDSIEENAHLSSLKSMDMDKVALLTKIMEQLGYFNLEDLETIYMIIEEYDLHKNAEMVANIATFLAQRLASEPLEETTLYQEHKTKGKVYQFRKISQKKEEY